MELKDAVEAFERLEARRYSGEDVEDGQPSWSPVYNIRLDAMTTDDGLAKRGFRLFVRLDKAAPDQHRSAAVGFILAVADDFGLDAELENGGVELT